MKDIKKYYKYLLVFIFIFLFNIFLNPLNLDEIWNYGFSYAISRGEIPYLDFNMVITPLFPFLLSIPLIIFTRNMIVYYLFSSLIYTFMFYYIFKNCDKKSCLFILLLIFPIPIIYPSYNMFLLLLFILLVEYFNKDYLMGFIISLLFLTKQSVGFIFCVIFIYLLFKDRKRFIKNFICFIIPCLVLFIYLICTGSLNSFIDLCFFGLFDFTGNSNFSIYFVFSILLFIYNIYLFYKYKKSDYLLLILFFSIVIPLFDLYHLMVYVFAFIYVMIKNNNFNIRLNITLFSYSIILFICIKYCFDCNFTFRFNDINNFNYKNLSNNYIKNTKEINKKFNSYSNSIMLGSSSYYFKIINDLDICYLDLINTGNYGYNGNLKFIDLIKKNTNSYYFIENSEMGTNKQSMISGINYVISNGKKIDSINGYDIYVLE